MSEAWQIALFTILGGWVFTITVGVAATVVVMRERLTRLETRFEDWLDRAGVLAAKVLHSPDNHLGIDGYLDSYIAHHHDMSLQEWADFHDICVEVTRDEKSTKLEKVQAEFLMQLCLHKISRSGLTHTKKLV